MTNFEIANILYDFSSDMDFSDYEESKEVEISRLEKSLDIIELEHKELYHVLLQPMEEYIS